jgi:RNA polymerase sigma factor for flagellar operon FliA
MRVNEEAALSERALAERDRLVMAHTDLVKSIARRMAQRLPPQVDVADLIGVGVMGLIAAATRYDPSTGVSFEAFGRRRIQGAMLDSLRDLDWVPRSLRRLRRTVEATVASLRRSLGREPEEAEICAALNMTQAEYEQALQRLRTLDVGAMRSIEEDSDSGGSRLELIADDGEGVLAQIERKELRAQLAHAIKDLPERERNILAMYFEEDMTIAEIGAVIGISESRVSQLRSLAFSRLRASMAEVHDTKGRKAA